MDAKQRLMTAIQKIKEHGYVPKHGKVVAEAYKNGEIDGATEDNLYLIAELLDTEESPTN